MAFLYVIFSCYASLVVKFVSDFPLMLSNFFLFVLSFFIFMLVSEDNDDVSVE